MFYLEDVGAAFSLAALRGGDLALGGGAARFRMLFWLAARGHDVYLLNHVDEAVVDRVRAVTVDSISEIPSLVRAIGPIDLFVFNYRDAAAELVVMPIPDARGKVMWAGNPFQPSWLLAIDDVRLARIACVSRYHQECYRPYPNFRRLEVVRSGIDLDIVDGLPDLERSAELVVFLGAPRVTKGFHNLLDAWPFVREAFPNARLRILGSARLHAADAALGWTGVLDRDLEERHLEPLLDGTRSPERANIEFAGMLPVRQVVHELRRAALAVVNCNWTGSFETYCRSALEAQAVGTPVVGAARGALREVVRDGETGFLVDEPSPRALAATIVRLLRDPEKRHAIGEAGRAWVRKSGGYELGAMDWEAIATRTAGGDPAPTKLGMPGDLLRVIGYGRARILGRRLLKGASSVS